MLSTIPPECPDAALVCALPLICVAAQHGRPAFSAFDSSHQDTANAKEKAGNLPSANSQRVSRAKILTEFARTFFFIAGRLRTKPAVNARRKGPSHVFISAVVTFLGR